MNNTLETPTLEALGITATVSAPLPDVRDDWPNIRYQVTFSKGARNYSTEYHLGVGHVNWKAYRDRSCNLGGFTTDEQTAIYTIQSNPGAVLKNKELWASAAAKLAKEQKVSPKPLEVLGCVCREVIEAHSESFDGWCGNLGYESDSIKALRIYEDGTANYHKIKAILNDEQMTQLAEYFNTL